MSCLPLCAGEEAHSQAYYIIKAAQERQELTEQVPHWQAACASSPPGSLCLQPAHAASPAQSLFYEVAGGPAVRVPGSRAQHAVWPLAYYANLPCAALPHPAVQAEGLRAQVAQAEQQCRALEATLRRLVGANSDMHSHFKCGGCCSVRAGVAGFLAGWLMARCGVFWSQYDVCWSGQVQY